MAVPTPLDQLTGEWTGDSALHRSWLEGDDKVHTATSALQVTNTVTFTLITYIWHLDGMAQEGALIVTANDGTTSASWTDTWHADGMIFAMTGATDEDGVLKVFCTYPAGDGPDWGWRIEIEASDTNLQLRMVNIDPEGTEEWAVQADYTRA